MSRIVEQSSKTRNRRQTMVLTKALSVGWLQLNQMETDQEEVGGEEMNLTMTVLSMEFFHEVSEER